MTLWLNHQRTLGSSTAVLLTLPVCTIRRSESKHVVEKKSRQTRTSFLLRQRRPLSAQATVLAEDNRHSCRRDIGQDILRVVAGRQPSGSKPWELELQAAVHRLPTTTVPRGWHELCRQVKDGGSQRALAALHWRPHRIPDVEGAVACGCQLTTQPYGRRFRSLAINNFLAELFTSIPHSVHFAGLPSVALSRFDLFHCHLFQAWESKRLGLLFHAKEYPAFASEGFAVDLGFCQQDSPLTFKEQEMRYRNLLWYEGHLCALDVGPGSVLCTTLLMDGLQLVCTVLESDFGQRICDINFLQCSRIARRCLFVCQ